jgi:hypothetical protein
VDIISLHSRIDNICVNLRFVFRSLPQFTADRVGQTVVVRKKGRRSGLIKVTWDGAEFVQEK